MLFEFNYTFIYNLIVLNFAIILLYFIEILYLIGWGVCELVKFI